jgi:hypothetical protein
VLTLDEKREELARAQKPASDATTVTVPVAKQKPGRYTLEGLWGGNSVCEEKIEIR